MDEAYKTLQMQVRSDIEGLEVAYHDAPIANPRHHEGLETNFGVGKEATRESSQLVPDTYTPDTVVPQQSPCQHKSNKRWWWITAIVLAVVVALGVRVGVGVSVVKKSHDPSTASQTQSTSASDPASTSPATTTSLATTALPSSPSTSSTVTSGITGTAAFSCIQASLPLTTNISPPNTPFVEECYVDYIQTTNWNHTAIVGDIGPKIIAYDFQTRIDQCVDYNVNRPPTPWRAVTYNANLTDIIPREDKNCFLKSARGRGVGLGYSGSTNTLFASAYMECVTDLTC
ncbi:hypothetical protein LTR17_008871 [Elasticomyces elasticus]|nr:hypothetical protein LTR17_008871 [Elasticomyces elasticus]